MRLHASTAYTIGLATALSLGAGTVARAQADPTRSRVPVTKERVAPPTKPEAAAPATREPLSAPVAARPDTAIRAAGEVVTPKDTATPAVTRPTCAMMPTAPGTRPSGVPVCGAMAATVEPGWEPGFAHLTGKRGSEERAEQGSTGEDPLDELEREIAALRAMRRPLASHAH